ncbi:MAG: hypothetical protein ABGZ23_26145 [Fuerstiella sp.]
MNLAFTGLISAALLGGIMLMTHVETADPLAHMADAIALRHSTGDAGLTVVLTGSDEPHVWKSFGDLHDRYTQAFVNSEGFGISRVLTFDTPEKRAFLVNGQKRRIHTVQLIGLNGDMPRAYESSFMNPTRSMLATSAHRALSDFENHAIERLRAGTDYVFSGEDHDPEHPHGTLVAALRASESCMECHDAKRGQLLGAFAYRLHAPLPSGNLDRSATDLADLLTSLPAKPE